MNSYRNLASQKIVETLTALSSRIGEQACIELWPLVLDLERVGGVDRVSRATAPSQELDAGLLADERDAALWAAVHALPERCWALLRTLMASPAPSYAEVAAALDMAIGSIGPTRQRCLDQLRRGVLGDPLFDEQTETVDPDDRQEGGDHAG